MFQDEYRNRFDLISPSPDFQRQLEERMEDMRIRQSMNRRKISVSLALVILALLILATGALAASGVLKSIFSNYTEDLIFADNHIESLDLQTLASLLDPKPQTKTVEFSNGSTVEVCLAEDYFNGRILVLGWSMTHDPDETIFIDEANFAPGSSNRKTEKTPAWVTDEALEEFARKFEQDGFACISYLTCEMDDYVFILNDAQEPVDLEDGREPIRAYVYGGNPKFWQEGNTTYMIDSEVYNGLPSAIANRDTIDVAHHISGVVHYYYQDATGCYTGNTDREWHLVPMTIRRNTEIEEKITESTAEFPDHTADITVCSSPIQIAVTIKSHLPEEDVQMWTEYYHANPGRLFTNPKNLERDVLEWYNLYINGKQMNAAWHAYPNTLHELFITPAEDFDSIVLRPVYCNTGEHPDEEIVIDLTR